MLWNSLLKKPVLFIGILMFSLFLFQVSRQKKWGVFHNEKFNSHSCRAVVIPLERRIPINWKIFCEGNNLAIEIEEVVVPDKASNLKALMYRQLANHMGHVARMSPQDILAKVDFVRLRLSHKSLEINAVTEGKFIVKLATLENPEHIMSHLQSTVQVKETLK
jgi:hypothetical protein